MMPEICPICNLSISITNPFLVSCKLNHYRLFHTSLYDVETITLNQFKLNSYIHYDTSITDLSDLYIVSHQLYRAESTKLYSLLANLSYISPTNELSLLHKFNTIKNFL